MAQSMLLPAFVALLGAVVVLFLAKPKNNEGWQQSASAARAAAGAPAPAAGASTSAE
jgi:hypothetical protein